MSLTQFSKMYPCSSLGEQINCNRIGCELVELSHGNEGVLLCSNITVAQIQDVCQLVLKNTVHVDLHQGQASPEKTVDPEVNGRTRHTNRGDSIQKMFAAFTWVISDVRPAH